MQHGTCSFAHASVHQIGQLMQTWVASVCRSLQGEPYAAVFHKRIKMSSGGHRIKIEQKFQLLAPGVLPIKYHSIWHRVEEENDGAASNAHPQQ